MRTDDHDGLRSLMAAVLMDCLRVLRDERHPKRIRTELAWLMDDDQSYPFAFRNVCQALDLDATAVRDAVLRDPTLPSCVRACA